MGLGQLPHYLTKKITPETYSKIQKLEGEPAELSAIKETINVLIDVIEDLSGGNGRNLFASRIGLGVFPPTCTIDAIDDTQSELAKFTSGGGFDFGFTSYYSNNSMRSRFGFAGGAGNIFTNGIANGTFVQANNGPLMLGVDTSLAMIIREVGYGPGTGYVGFGGVNDPLSTVEIGGENAPRLGLNPQASAVGRKHWEIVSLANDYGSENGNLQFYNRTDGIGSIDITPNGDINATMVGTADVAPTTWTVKGRNAGVNATGTNKRGGLYLLRGGNSADASAFKLQVGIGSPASGGEVGADDALTYTGDRAAVTLKSEYRGGAPAEGRFALNLIANGANAGDVLTQRTKYNGVWAQYDGWLYDNKVVSVSNASISPNGQQIAQAAQATPDVLVNLLTLAISAGSDVRALFGEVVIQTGAGTPEGNVVAPPGSIYFNRTGGVNQSLYVKESGAGNVGWIGK